MEEREGGERDMKRIEKILYGFMISINGLLITALGLRGDFPIYAKLTWLALLLFVDAIVIAVNEAFKESVP